MQSMAALAGLQPVPEHRTTTQLYIISIGARAFQKSAFTAIYEAGGKLVHTCDYFSDYKPVSGTEAGLMEAANRPNQ